LYSKNRYKSYIFSIQSQIRSSKIDDDVLKKTTEIQYYFDNLAGTSTIIFSEKNKIALLSCAHIFDRPDTIITYYEIKNDSKEKFIQSISFKIEQKNLVADFPNDSDLKILLMDQESDLVILNKEFIVPRKMNTPVIEYPFGRAKDLEWGSFVYIIGYPKGFQMITRAIVSQPNRNNKGSFLLDALFNRGMSGGLVMAVRDGVPNFEIVGIVNSAFSNNIDMLVPIEEQYYNENIPYDGNIYIKHKNFINYGMCLTISSEKIILFLKKNIDYLYKKGYDFKYLIDNF
jgi:hypothetical protein